MAGQLSPLFTWRSAIVESDLHSTTKLVALVLSLHMNERGGSAFPAVPTLGREASLSPSTTRDHIRQLNERGWLEREIRGGRESNRYTATVPIIHTPPGAGGVVIHTPPGTGAHPTGQPAPTPPGTGAEDVHRGRSSKNTSAAEVLGRDEQHAPAPTKAQRQATWDALVEIYGDVADHERSLRGKIARDLTAACLVQLGSDADPKAIAAELRRRATAYRRAWPGAAFTDTALHRRWSVFAPAVMAATTPREKAKRWLDSTGWRFAEEDAVDMLVGHFGLTPGQLEGALIYRRDVAAEQEGR